MLSRGALASIFLYQRWISPHKGFRCAHSILHGGTGCSGYVKQEIRRQGLLAALPAIRTRFATCRLAKEDLVRKQKEDNRSRTGSACDGAGSGCECPPLPKGCIPEELPCDCGW